MCLIMFDYRTIKSLPLMRIEVTRPRSSSVKAKDLGPKAKARTRYIKVNGKKRKPKLAMITKFINAQ